MEDYLHFLEYFSLYVFRGSVLPPVYKEMWLLLRRACIHYFRADSASARERPFSQAAREAARDALMEYARLVEQARLWYPPACLWVGLAAQGCMEMLFHVAAKTDAHAVLRSTSQSQH